MHQAIPRFGHLAFERLQSSAEVCENSVRRTTAVWGKSRAVQPTRATISSVFFHWVLFPFFLLLAEDREELGRTGAGHDDRPRASRRRQWRERRGLWLEAAPRAGWRGLAGERFLMQGPWSRHASMQIASMR